MSATRSIEESSKPGYPEYLRGVANYAENKFVEAQKELAAAAASGYEDPNLFFLLGEIDHNKGNELRAIEYFNRAISIDSNCLKAHLQLGVIMCNRGDYTQAENHFEKMLESTNSYNLLAWMHKGAMYFIRARSTSFDDSSDRAGYYQQMAACYKQIVDKPAADVPIHIMLRSATELCRLLKQFRPNQGVDLNINVDKLNQDLDRLIAELKAKDNKTVEEICVLLLAQLETKRYAQGWAVFTQLLELHVGANDSLYDRIPAYLKRDFFAALILWPAESNQKVTYTPEKTEQMKQAIVDLLKARDTENYAIRVMQINVGLLALTFSFQLGVVLYVQQGSFFAPTLSSGKLNILAANLTQGISTMRAQEAASLAGPMRICKRTKEDLETMQYRDSLIQYPVIYEAVFGVMPPMPQSRWVLGLFGGAAQPSQRVASPTPPTDVIRTAP